MALLRAIKLHDTVGFEENIHLFLLVLGPGPTPHAMGGGCLYVISSRHFTLIQAKPMHEVDSPLLLFNR